MATEIIQAGARLSVTTQNAVIRKAIAPIYQKDYFLAEMMKRGRFAKRQGGKRIEWRMEMRRLTPTPVSGYPEGPVSYPSTNFWKEASLPWRQYRMTQRIDAFEKLAQQNGGSDVTPVDVIPIVEGVTKKLVKDFTAGLATEMFVDGNAGNANQIHGLESWFGGSSCVSNSAFVSPDDTYAGISTALGNYGGEWTAGTGYGWPHGTGDAEYYFASPLMVDYNNTLLTATDTGDTNSWQYQWESAIRMLTSYGEVLQRGPYDVVLLDPELLRIARDSLADRTRFIAKTPAAAQTVGWKEYDFEGLSLVTQYGVTSACGYALRFENLELRSMLGQLIETEKDFDLDSNSDEICLRSYLQLVCDSPAYQGKLVAITTAGT